MADVQFYFIRHAQSENNLLWERTGASVGRVADPDLTLVGRQQAQILARYLRGSNPPSAVRGRDLQNRAGFGLTHLYSSLMVRAVATGAVVARALGLPLVGWEDAHESGGIYRKDELTGERIGQAGNDRTFFEAHYPDLVLPGSLAEGGWWNRPFEEREQRPARAQCFLRQLLERHGHTEDRVALVSHGGFYNYLMAALLRLPDREGIWFAMNNAAITRVDFLDERGEYEEYVGLIYTNRVDHLPPELVT